MLMFYTLFYKNTCNIIKHDNNYSSITQSHEKREYLNNFSLLDDINVKFFCIPLVKQVNENYLFKSN